MDVNRDLLHEASNILWSAENGGYNGRPSEVRRILRAIIADSGVDQEED